jgi:predicted PurR-regulated permease PerM
LNTRYTKPRLWYDNFVCFSMEDRLLNKGIKILLFIFLLALLLHYGKPFFVPLTFAALLSMLLLPVSLKLEKWGVNKSIAIIISILLIVLFFGGVIYMISWQISDLSKDASRIEQNINHQIQQVKDFVSHSFGISPQKQTKIIQQQKSDGKLASMLSSVLAATGTLLTSFILVLVYIFLFMYFRAHLKRFVLMIVPKNQQANTKQVIDNATTVSRKYITGLMLMIASLWVMYSIGFAIVGVKSFILFAVVCGLLEIVPFIGNITGNLLTIVVVLAQGGGFNMVIGVLVTYSIVQFVQSYLLQPLVVGREVNVNPVFTIVGLVAGEFLWGIPGMILAVPVLGIIKIICDHVEPLKPYGFLIGEEKKSNSSVTDKLKSWFS